MDIAVIPARFGLDHHSSPNSLGASNDRMRKSSGNMPGDVTPCPSVLDKATMIVQAAKTATETRDSSMVHAVACWFVTLKYSHCTAWSPESMKPPVKRKGTDRVPARQTQELGKSPDYYRLHRLAGKRDSDDDLRLSPLCGAWKQTVSILGPSTSPSL